jgi:Pregnancy-associated plasma protein-A
MRARSVVGLMCFLAVGCGGMADPEVGTSSSALKKKGPGGRDRCAVRPLSDAEQEAVERDLSASASQSKATGGVVNVPVYIHVVKASDGSGSVLPQWLTDQVDVLNAAFASSGFQFQLVSQDEVTNDAWYFSVLGSAEEQEMKAALRQGGADALNLYTTAGDVYLGWATFPAWYRGPLKSYDGVVIWWAALPGTGLKIPGVEEEPDGLIEYDLGDTATHEVGHWLGLYHTFQGACAKNGDRIDDTPAELEPQFFCAGRDSCTGKKFPGSDPIHNFMDYVDDRCMDHFTGDQQERMQKQWRIYRAKGT